MSRPQVYATGAMLALSRQGLTARDIAKRLGCTLTTVYMRLNEAGIPAPRKRKPVASMAVIDVACDLMESPTSRDVDIARSRNCSREYVGQIRCKLEIRGAIPAIARNLRHSTKEDRK